MTTLTRPPAGGSITLQASRSASFGGQESLTSIEDFRIVTNVRPDDVPASLRRDCVLFYAPDCKELAEKIAEASEGTVKLGSIRWKCVGARSRGARRRALALRALPPSLCATPPHGRRPPTPHTHHLLARRAIQTPIPDAHCTPRNFPDGFPDLFVHEATEIRNRHVGFLASFHDPALIFEQISIIYALPRLFISSFTLVLPFFPTGTAERVRRQRRGRQPRRQR